MVDIKYFPQYVEVICAAFLLMEYICTFGKSITTMLSVKILRIVFGVLCVRRHRGRQGMCSGNSQASVVVYIN